MFTAMYGLAAPAAASDLDSIARRMVSEMWVPDHRSAQLWRHPDEPVTFGALYSESPEDRLPWAEDRSTGALCVLEGHALLDTLPTSGHSPRQLDAGELLELYLREGRACLRQLGGSFNVVWWTPDDRALVVANDRFGRRHLYFHTEGPRLQFASRLGAVIAGCPRLPSFDPEALGSWLRYRYPPDLRTLFEGVSLLPPASLLRWQDGRTRMIRYWRIDEIAVQGRYDGSRLSRLETALRSSVCRAIGQSRHAMIGLTGGLDSRCILAASLAEGLPARALTDGLPDSADLRLARELCELSGTEHVFEPVDADRLGSWLPLMVRMQGASVPTLETHPCRYLAAPPDCDTLALGMLGEPARGGIIDPRALAYRDRGEVVDAIESKLLTPMALHDGTGTLWNPAYRNAALESPRARLESTLGEYRFSRHVAEIMEHFYVEFRGRRFLLKAPLIVQKTLPVAMPYLGSEWVDEVFSLPLEDRLRGRVQLDLIRKLWPDLLNVPFDRPHRVVGLPGLGGRFRLHGRRLARRALRRLGLRRRSEKIAPAFRYGEWSRREMRPEIAALLYNPRAAHREFLRWPVLERRLDAHFSGRHDDRHLVAALVVAELAHGLWIEPGRLPPRIQALPGVAGRS